MRIDADALPVLAAGFTEGAFFRFPEKLDRALYVKVDKALRAAGGKWNRVLKAHLLPGDAGEIVEAMLLTGQITSAKSEFGEFFTPPALAKHVATVADIEPGMRLLEPSAGQGALVAAVQEFGAVVTAVEVQQIRLEALEALQVDVVVGDFLAVPTRHFKPFDRVVMNPPFAKQADIRHVIHADSFLRPRGRLVAVMSAGIEFRQDHLTSLFRAHLAANGAEIERLPQGSFAASGTDVNTVLVSYTKAGPDD